MVFKADMNRLVELSRKRGNALLFAEVRFIKMTLGMERWKEPAKNKVCFCFIFREKVKQIKNYY